MLALLVAALLLIGVMVALGLWQLGVYDASQRADAQALLRIEPVPLDRALGPDDPFPPGSVGVPVTAEGRYDASEQMYVRGLPGVADSFAVVTPLVTPSGSAVLVVRGSHPLAESQVPHGRVQLVGVLEPSQSVGSTLDRARVTDGIRISGLVNDVTPDLYAGYVVRTSSNPADPLTQVPPPLPDPSRWAGVRNLVYALQWWVFAGFVAFMWWRIVSDASNAEPRAADAESADAETVG